MAKKISGRKKYCRIPSCPNNRGFIDNDIQCFRMPAPGTEIRTKWEVAMKTLYNMDIYGEFQPLICSQHFERCDLYKKRENEYGLRPGAVPSVPIDPVDSNSKGNTSFAAAEHVEVKLEPNENNDIEMLEDYGEIKVYIEISDDDTNTNTNKNPKFCVKCIHHEITIQKHLEKAHMYQKKCESVMKENQILRAQLKYFNDKCNALANQGKIQKFEPKDSCEVCCGLLTPTELKQHLCISDAQIICEYCSRSFTTTIEFSDHLTQNHPITKMYECGRCEMVFSASVLLKFHLESNSTHSATISSDEEDIPMNRLFQCAVCDMGFELPTELKEHMRKVHIDRMVNLVYQSIPTDLFSSKNRFECYICKKELNNKLEVKRHLKHHVAARDQKCVVCCERLTLNEVNEHVCHPKKKLTCEYCNGTFKATSKYLEHIDNIHKDEILYKCRKCYLYLRSMNLRDLHEGTHPKKQPKPFSCEICSKGFSDKTSLKIHSLTHSNQRNHLCAECGKGFKTDQGLRKHSITHGEKTLKCPDCPLTFRSIQVYKNHREIHSNVQYKCNECDKIVFSKMSLACHTKRVHRKIQRAKKYSCSFCPMMFINLERLNVHVRKHTGDKPFKCQYCEDRHYAYKQDLLKHLEKDHEESTPYECDLCKKKFRRYVELLRHCCEEYKKQTAIKTEEVAEEET